MESYAEKRIREIMSDPTLRRRPPEKWSSRSLPAPRLDKDIARPTDLYFIETECAERHIKIGVASNVQRRMSKMQMDCPYKLRLLAVIPGGAQMEQQLHQRFIADRLTGEWFRRSDALLAAIDELAAVHALSLGRRA